MEVNETQEEVIKNLNSWLTDYEGEYFDEVALSTISKVRKQILILSQNIGGITISLINLSFL